MTLESICTQGVDTFRGLRPNPSLILKMCYKMYDQSQKWSGHIKKICESECIDHIYTVGFIIFAINIFAINFGRLSFQIQLKIPNRPNFLFLNVMNSE